MSATGDITQLQTVFAPPVKEGDFQLGQLFTALLTYVTQIDTRITTAETAASTLAGRVTAAETAATALALRVTALEHP